MEKIEDNFYEAIMKRLIEKIEEDPRPKHPFELFGIEHGFGWYGLILPIINELRIYNEQHPGDEISIDQIKEKYGTLRFYVSSAPDYILGMITKAERESENICEICGAKGKLTEINGWYVTRCEHHLKAWKESNDDISKERLYRIIMDKYEKIGWSKSRDIKIKKTRKNNCFIAKNKIFGKLYEIKLEREKDKTYFYVKKGKNFEKNEFYVQWEENDDKLTYGGYWYTMNNNEIIIGGECDREYQEEECAIKIFDFIEKQLKNENEQINKEVV